MILDFPAALARISALQTAEPEGVNPVCRYRCFSHGRKTARAIVFFHGYTNCPQQFEQLGKIFFERGWNVLIPRAPHQGLADRLSPEQAQLTAEELIALVEESLDLAHGLGEQVTLVGLSMGGVMTAWAAQQRADLDRAVIISPAFGLQAIPARWTRLAAAIARRLPNFFRWKDPALGAKSLAPDAPGPAHAYPRYSSRGLAAMLRLRFVVEDAARRARPAARSILVITNPTDEVVDNAAAEHIVELWRKRGADAQTYQFERALGLPHDFIDPGKPGDWTRLSYPILIPLLAGEM